MSCCCCCCCRAATSAVKPASAFNKSPPARLLLPVLLLLPQRGYLLLRRLLSIQCLQLMPLTLVHSLKGLLHAQLILLFRMQVAQSLQIGILQLLQLISLARLVFEQKRLSH